MIKTNEQELRDLFTMKYESVREIAEDLDIDVEDLLRTIVKLTSNPQDFRKVDELSKIVYLTTEAYRQGFMAALYYFNEVNKDTINALANNKDVTIA